MTLEKISKIIETLQFYADPATYFAIGFFPDRPCGDFIEDFSETELGMKPGKMARECLDFIENKEGGSDGEKVCNIRDRRRQD